MNVTKRLATCAASATLAAALLPFAASPAAAETQWTTDTAGDTSNEDGPGPGPGQATADIVAFRSHHGEERVTVRLEMAAMRDGGKFYATTVVKTDDGVRYEMHYARTRRGGFEDLDVVRGTRAKGRILRCPGAAAKFLLEEQAVRISMPRRCLDNPKWVQTGALVETRPPQPMAKVYYDDARRDGDASERRIKVGGRRLASG